MQTAIYGGWLTDAGSYLGKTTRGILDVAGYAINTVVTRGGADSGELVTTGTEAPKDFTAPLLIGGAALVGAMVLLRKKKRRR